MKLATAKEPDGKTPSRTALAFLALDTAEQRRHGREVWLDHCAICHSSKQPKDFGLNFERKPGGITWDRQVAPTNGAYTLPMDGTDWLAFKRSPAYTDYKAHLHALVRQAGDLDGDPLVDGHPFWKDNYLSTDVRVPITLARTQSGRALASNGIEKNVWDNFSSLTYKGLPAVGKIGYFNPINAQEASFDAPGGGRGYYRPATHISLWATAPYLHNNSMGVFLEDPSVKGRLVQFTDAVRRLLWEKHRSSRALVLSDREQAWLQDVQATEAQANGNRASVIDPHMVVSRLGDLRGSGSMAAVKDTGFIYRVPQDTSVEFPAVFVRPLVAGIAGKFLTSILEIWLWVALVLWFAFLAWKHRPRYLGITLLGLAVLVAAGLALSGLGGGGNTIGVLLMAASGLLELSSWQWWFVAASLAVSGVIFIQAKPDTDDAARGLLGLLLLGLVYGVWQATRSVWIAVLVLAVAFILWTRVRPTLSGFSRLFFLALTLITATVGYGANCFINGRALVTIPVVNKRIGPFDVKTGPIPRGTPVSLVMNMDPESPKLPKALVSMVLAMAEIKKRGLTGEAAWPVFQERAGQALLDASKCPDFVMDRGHLFGETLDPDPVLNEQAKEDLIAFLKTL